MGKINLVRALLIIFLPPLAVVDCGCGAFLFVLLLTFLGWVPGSLGALIILTRVAED